MNLIEMDLENGICATFPEDWVKQAIKAINEGNATSDQIVDHFDNVLNKINSYDDKKKPKHLRALDIAAAGYYAVGILMGKIEHEFKNEVMH